MGKSAWSFGFGLAGYYSCVNSHVAFLAGYLKVFHAFIEEVGVSLVVNLEFLLGSAVFTFSAVESKGLSSFVLPLRRCDVLLVSYFPAVQNKSRPSRLPQSHYTLRQPVVDGNP